MMICGKCQTINNDDAKFCINCGKQIDHLKQNPVENEPEVKVEATATQATDENPTSAAGAKSVQPPKRPMEPDPTIEMAKEIGQSFWNYLLNGLKAPYQASKEVGAKQADLINGLITLIIFSAFLPLSVYLSGTMLMPGWGRPSFIRTVVIPFFLFILFIAITVAVLFAVARLMNSNIDFLQVFTRFMTFMIIPAGLALLSFVVSIFNAYLFSTILMSLVFLTMFLASIATIFTIKDTKEKPGGLDVTYVIIIHFLIMTIVLLLFSDALIGQLINQMMW